MVCQKQDAEELEQYHPAKPIQGNEFKSFTHWCRGTIRKVPKNAPTLGNR
jgi:hypothetical protein